MAWDDGAVIVTGAGSGLGAAVAEAVREAGGTAVGFDRCQPRSPDDLQVDVADRDAVTDAVHQVLTDHGTLAAVVTAAGIDRCGGLLEVAPDEWDRVIAVNLLGTVNVVRAALPGLLAHHGRVITVASTLGLRAVPDATAYCASKFGVVGFSRALAGELAGQVGVTLLVPGGMSTAFFDDRDERYRPGPDASLSPPREVAATVLAALRMPRDVELRELVVTPSRESSWP